MSRQTPEIALRPLLPGDRDAFIEANQRAFQRAAVAEFGPLDTLVIPREDIENSLDAETAQSFQIVCGDAVVGGVVLQIDGKTRHNSLDLLFLNENAQNRGVGSAVWRKIEEKYPDTILWETHTPYFEKRNIHFYVNRCGFHIVEFFNPKHPDPHSVDTPGGEYFFRFEKRMKL